MEPIKTVNGELVAIPHANIDTDQIMPKQFMKRVTTTGYEDALFYHWRRDDEGNLDPDFVLNKPAYEDANVLVAGPNFGSGSSREHAPWGLRDWGFKVIISPKFADIFRNNCANVGILTIEMSQDVVDELTRLADDPPAQVTVDLPSQTIETSTGELHFDIDQNVKHRLLNGLDNIDVTLQAEDEITAYEERRPDWIASLG